MPNNTLAVFALSACWLATISPPALAGTIFVDPTSPTDGPGNTWSNAYHSLENAVNMASTGDDILLAKDTYFPDGTETVGAGGNQDWVFRLKNGVALRGGFKGYKTTGSGTTNPLTPEGPYTGTVLSGDLGTVGTQYDNAHHVVVVDTSGQPIKLVGALVTDGVADGSSSYMTDVGGGLYVSIGSSPTKIEIEHVTFRDCHADSKGGALYASPGQSEFEVAFCKFRDNYADLGGAAFFKTAKDVQIGNSEFFDNGNMLEALGGPAISGSPAPLVEA